MSSVSSPIPQEVYRWPPVRDAGQSDDGLFYARAFGNDLADIELNLGHPSRPDSITRLLHHCLFDSQGQHFADEAIWQWSVKRRLQGVLAIASASLGNGLDLTSRCLAPDCDEQLAIELDLRDFIDADDITAIHCEPEPDIGLILRLPTGLDQRHWQQFATNQDSTTLLQQMGRSLVSLCNGQPLAEDFSLPETWLAPIDETLEAADRFTALSLSAQCPVCGTDNEIALDLEIRLLELLAGRQRQVLEHIHLLASTYHWTEKEVMRLPPSRRHFYIQRIRGAVR